jgi:hypothetical protein
VLCRACHVKASEQNGSEIEVGPTALHPGHSWNEQRTIAHDNSQRRGGSSSDVWRDFCVEQDIFGFMPLTEMKQAFGVDRFHMHFTLGLVYDSTEICAKCPLWL